MWKYKSMIIAVYLIISSLVIYLLPLNRLVVAMNIMDFSPPHDFILLLIYLFDCCILIECSVCNACVVHISCQWMVGVILMDSRKNKECTSQLYMVSTDIKWYL